MQWYYAIDGQRLGPVSHSEFERLVQAGTISGDALVWRQGLDQWRTLSAVMARDPGMFAGLPPPVPVEVKETSEEDFSEAPVSAELEEAAPVRPAVEIPAEEEQAGFLQRAGAYLIDLILWFFIWNILANIVAHKFFPAAMKLAEAMAVSGGRGNQPSTEEAVMILKLSGTIMLLGFVLAVLYDLVFLLRFSATPGKLLFGIRVGQADGRPLGFMRIMARCLAKGLSGVPTLGIGFLIAAFDDQKRGLHDFFCNTRVFKKR